MRARRRNWLFEVSSGPCRKCRRCFIFGEEVGRVLRKLRNGNKGGQIAKIGAFVIEFDKSVVLCIVATAQWHECFVVSKSCILSAYANIV